MPRRAASAFIFATKAGMLPASQRGQQVGEIVGRVHEQPAEHLLLAELLAQRHLRVGVVVDGVGVVVVDVGLASP